MEYVDYNLVVDSLLESLPLLVDNPNFQFLICCLMFAGVVMCIVYYFHFKLIIYGCSAIKDFAIYLYKKHKDGDK